MTPEEQGRLAALPNTFVIHRGAVADNMLGWSWTLHSEQARWFANRFPIDGMPLVVTARVHKAKVLGYINDIGEEEIVIDPDSVAGVKVTVLPAKPMTRSDWSSFQGRRGTHVYSEG